jgi:hypothetical protein
MLRQQQEQIDKLTAIVALRELKIERMVEKQSHYEAMAHASGFEAGVCQQKAEIEAVKKTNGQLVDLVQLHREEMEKMRQEILMWENADVPTEVMADLVEELERRGFITK